MKTFKEFLEEMKNPCWKGYKAYGMKKKGGKTVPNCVKEETLDEKSAAWQRKEGKNPEGGLNRKGIASYRRENPGSKLSMADRKSTRLNSSHVKRSRMPSSA